MAMFGRATRNDVLRSYTPTMAERIPIAVQGFLGRLGLNKYQARSFGQPIADVLGYSPVGAVAQSWDAGQAAALAPGMFGKAGALGGGMALAALGAVPGGKALRKGEALAMDEASRMARAAEQGFDTATSYYHGGPNVKNITELRASGGGELGRGVYVTKSNPLAENYSLGRASDDGVPAGAGVLDLLAAGKMKPMTKQEWLADRSAHYAEEQALNGGEWDAGVAKRAEQKQLERYKAEGYSGIYLTGDERGRPIESGRSQDQGVIFDPANIRSKFAAFDPAKRGSANLLAGIGAGAMLAPSMFGNRGGER